ncbi:MAG: Ig-like domain repeat protein [Janthinobacterium lividum]
MALQRRPPRICSNLRHHMLALMMLAVSGSAAAQATVVLQPGSSLSTLAGTGVDGRSKAGDARLTALGSPQAIAYDAAGNLYIADTRNHQVSRIDTAGQLTIFAGTGRQGFSGDGGSATAAEWNAPGGIAVDAAGNIFVADTGNNRIRRIATADGIVSTIAGSGPSGFSGDNGPAVAAQLRSPGSLAVDAGGTLYISDVGNHRIRKLLPDGTITTVAGNGAQGQDGDGGPAMAASLDTPSGLVVLADGRLLIADRSAHRVRVLQQDGTIAGYAAGAMSMRRPAGLATDSNGGVYIADAANQIVVQDSPDGASAFAGSGVQGETTGSAPLTTAMDTPVAVATRANGDTAIGDSHNHQIQRVSLPSLDFGSIPAGSQSKAQMLTLQNGGTSPLTLLSVDEPGGFARLDAASTCGATPLTLSATQQCNVAITFAPIAQGVGDAVARVRVLGGAPQSVLLRGSGTGSGSLSSTITSLRSGGNIAYAGASIALTATVAGSLLRQPLGNINFLDGTSTLGSVAVNAGGSTMATASLSPGTHTLRAAYSGDAVYSSSTSTAVAVTVVPAPDFTMTASAASYSGKSAGTVTIPMTLLPINGTLNRPVQFVVTGLPTGATATFAPATLTLGGDTAAVTLTVQLPSTLSRTDVPSPAFKLLACTFLFAGLLHRRRAVTGILGLALCGICTVGCGSGFRAGNTAANLPGTTHNYTAVVTATTTGVLGTPLAHSTSIGLVLTQ